MVSHWRNLNSQMERVMRLMLAVAAGALIAAAAAAPGAGPAIGEERLRPLETTDEARQRHGARRWDDYESRGRRPPLGGYRETPGDPAPAGTPEPGYVAPRPTAPDAGGGHGGPPRR